MKFIFNGPLKNNFDPTCEEFSIEKQKAQTETDRWIKEKTQKCPKCDIIIEKSGGCDHIKCQVCKFDFCWICHQEYAPGHLRDFHPQPRNIHTNTENIRQLAEAQMRFIAFQRQQAVLLQNNFDPT